MRREVSHSAGTPLWSDAREVATSVAAEGYRVLKSARWISALLLDTGLEAVSTTLVSFSVAVWFASLSPSPSARGS